MYVNDTIVGIVRYTTYNTMVTVTGSLPLLSSKCLMRAIRYPKEATYTTCDDRHYGFTQYTTIIVQDTTRKAIG